MEVDSAPTRSSPAAAASAARVGARGAAAVAFALGLGACGGDQGTSATASTDGALPRSCQLDNRGESYQPGMQHTGIAGRFTVRLVSATPAPPLRFDNRWTVEVLDAAAHPVDGATLTVVPFMPDHGHGTTRVTVSPLGGGQYALDGLNLYMGGLWRVTIGVATADQSDTAAFYFCIEG